VPDDAVHHHGLTLDHPDRKALSRRRQIQREPLLAAHGFRADYPQFFLFRVVLFDDDVAWDSQGNSYFTDGYVHSRGAKVNPRGGGTAQPGRGSPSPSPG